jgi:hypothetical protein
MQQSVVQEDWQMFVHLYDLPADRAGIFSALRKMKTAEEKILQQIDVSWVNFSDYKCKKLNA